MKIHIEDVLQYSEQFPRIRESHESAIDSLEDQIFEIKDESTNQVSKSNFVDTIDDIFEEVLRPIFTNATSTYDMLDFAIAYYAGKMTAIDNNITFQYEDTFLNDGIAYFPTVTNEIETENNSINTELLNINDIIEISNCDISDISTKESEITTKLNALNTDFSTAETDCKKPIDDYKQINSTFEQLVEILKTFNINDVSGSIAKIKDLVETINQNVEIVNTYRENEFVVKGLEQRERYKEYLSLRDEQISSGITAATSAISIGLTIAGFVMGGPIGICAVIGLGATIVTGAFETAEAIDANQQANSVAKGEDAKSNNIFKNLLGDKGYDKTKEGAAALDNVTSDADKQKSSSSSNSKPNKSNSNKKKDKPKINHKK